MKMKACFVNCFIGLADGEFQKLYAGVYGVYY